MEKRSNIHDRVLNASSLEDIESGYRDWATGYDKELVDGAGYIAPKYCAETLKELLPAGPSTVLDAGCGTGLVGECLADRKDITIDGLDYSTHMLEVAADKDCYRKLVQADLNVPLEIESNQYDAVVCVGTFTTGHVGPEAMLELLRVIKPGGYLLFTVRDSFWQEAGFEEVIEGIANRGETEIVSTNEMPYIEKEGSTCQQVIMRAKQ